MTNRYVSVYTINPLPGHLIIDSLNVITSVITITNLAYFSNKVLYELISII